MINRCMLPSCLEAEFPSEWASMLEMWDLDTPYHSVRIRLWHQGFTHATPQTYWNRSSEEFLGIWEWLEARFVMPRTPELEMSGDGSWGSGPQQWSRVRITSTYWLGRRLATTS